LRRSAPIGLAAVALLAVPALAEPKSMVQLRGLFEYPCTSNSPCETEVIVSEGSVRADGTPDPTGCQVAWSYSGYEVAQGKSPQLRWKLKKKSNSDPATYRFDSTEGIRLNPDDANDTTKDLSGPGHVGGNKMTFRWKSLNKRKRDDAGSSDPTARPIRFDFVVWRQDGRQCQAVDPVVINRGQ
jgi:hypothetical protein